MFTFTTNPSYVFEEEIAFKTAVITYEDGTELRHSYGSPRRTFTLRFLSVDQATRDEIHNFHQSVYGAYMSFLWTNPISSVQYTVRFLDDTLQEDNISYNQTDGHIFNIEIKFYEVV